MNSHVSRWNLIFSVLLRNSTQNAMQAYVQRYCRPTSTHYSRCLTALGLRGKHFSSCMQTAIRILIWFELGSQNQNRKSRNTGASFRFLRASTWSVNLHLSWESPCWATLWPCVKFTFVAWLNSFICNMFHSFFFQSIVFEIWSNARRLRQRLAMVERQQARSISASLMSALVCFKLLDQIFLVEFWAQFGVQFLLPFSEAVNSFLL